ncbi:MAG: DUF2807 domain-containing protein [Melioribacteraceae bacterium]|nr:DUF2807 domain-containing protein [Melioribacteraceae bacterium]
MKNKLIAILSAFAIIITGCYHWDGIRGSGDMADEYRDIESFDEIEISGAFYLNVLVGESPSLKITGDDNLLKFVRTRVRGNRLIIDTRKNINTRKEMKIFVTTDYLERIDASGANNIKVRGIDSESFVINLSGACKAELDGVTDRLSAELSGATKLFAYDLRGEKVKIGCSGASKAEIFAREYLDAEASGVAKIRFYGDPEDIRTDVSGIASISSR